MLTLYQAPILSSLLNPHQQCLWKRALLLFPQLYRWGNRAIERFRTMPKITRHEVVKMGFEPRQPGSKTLPSVKSFMAWALGCLGCWAQLMGQPRHKASFSLARKAVCKSSAPATFSFAADLWDLQERDFYKLPGGSWDADLKKLLSWTQTSQFLATHILLLLI